MIYFNNDYSESCHPLIMKHLMDLGQNQYPGYGLDNVTKQAKEVIKKQFHHHEVDVHFVVGGTQANLISLAAFLRPYEAIIACNTGHINVHETGAIEATGHKICLVEEKEGKLTPKAIEEVVLSHRDEHMVKPRLVFISNSTELGTIYNREELTHLRSICDQFGLLLYLDGARLGSALTCEGNDVELSDLPSFCDAFYIGGTKNGALFGEAIIIVNPLLKENFRYHIKQRGALLAKGYTLGAQFLALFRDSLFFDIASNANQKAALIRRALQNKGIDFLYPTTTNQLFPIFTKDQFDRLSQHYIFTVWQQQEHQVVARIVTSWASQDCDVDALCQHINEL